MLMPSKVKYRKQQRGRMRGKAWRGSDLSFGDYGLKVLEPGWITDRQIEASRVAIMRFIKRGGKLWIRIFPDKPVTKKPAETRMGKGKGAPEFWVAVVKPGRILFEMEGVPEAEAREAMRLASHKLALPTQFVSRVKRRHSGLWSGDVMKLEKDKTMEVAGRENAGMDGRRAEDSGTRVFRPTVPAEVPDGERANGEHLTAVRELRKGIAKVKTLLRERQEGATEPKSAAR